MIREDDLRNEITKLLDAHNSNEIDSKDEWYREMVYFRDVVVKKLTIPVVSNNEAVICPNCNKYKRLQGNGMIHELCECSEVSVCDCENYAEFDKGIKWCSICGSKLG